MNLTQTLHTVLNYVNIYKDDIQILNSKKKNVHSTSSFFVLELYKIKNDQ